MHRYEQYSALPEERWRELLCDAFHVKLELLTPEVVKEEEEKAVMKVQRRAPLPEAGEQ